MSQQCLAAHELSWRHDCAAILASGLTISVNCTLFRNLQAFGSDPNKPLWSMLQCLGACRSVLPQNLARSRTFEAAVPPCFWKCWCFFPLAMRTLQFSFPPALRPYLQLVMLRGFHSEDPGPQLWTSTAQLDKIYNFLSHGLDQTEVYGAASRGCLACQDQHPLSCSSNSLQHCSPKDDFPC